SPTLQPEAGEPEQTTGIYVVQENDTLAYVAEKFGTSIATLQQLNGLTDENIVFVGQPLVIPMPKPREQQVTDLRGFLFISVYSKGDGISSKEYMLEVA